MQFNQPGSFPFSGNEYQRISYHSYRPTDIPPEVVGEGDITSIVLPDGTVHFFFVPLYKHNPHAPFQYKFNINESHYQWRAGPEVWLVRSIPNPSPFTCFNNQPQNVFRDQIAPPPYYESNCNINIPNNGYFQKFHNDGATSTSDIYYFYPSLRPPIEKPKACAAVQVATPREHFDTICCKYCKRNVKHNFKTDCNCHETECSCHMHSNSDMSVDEIVHKPHKRKYHRKPKRKNQKEQFCDCGQKTSTSDKLVATYADQSSNCIAKDGRETQTKRQSCLKSDKQTEEWTPSRCNRKPHIEILAPSRDTTHRIQSSNSNMSVEETNYNPSKKKWNKKSNAKRYKDGVSGGRKTSTSDKLVTTYTDQSSHCIARDGRETQTPQQKTKKSDIQTEVWVPLRKRQPHIRILTPGQTSSDSCTTESCDK